MANKTKSTRKIPGFGRRLQEVMKTLEIEHGNAHLAQITGYSKSAVTGWLKDDEAPLTSAFVKMCKELPLTQEMIYYILGVALEDIAEFSSSDDSIRWEISNYTWLEEKQRKEIDRGIKLFEAFVQEQRSAEDVFRQLNISDEEAALAVQSAFRSHALQITYVRPDDTLGNKVRDKYGLRRVIVASLPHSFDGNLIRSEIVAFLGATKALQNLENPNIVGFGSGHTILRMAEMSVPSCTQFSNTEWLPLMAFRGQSANEHSISARSICNLMAVRHPGTTVIGFPYVDADSPVELKEKSTSVLKKKYAKAYAFFLTVSGEGRSAKGREGDFRELNYKYPLSEEADISNMYKLMREQRNESNKENFAGEILGLMLDKRGHILKSIAEQNRSFVFPSNPDTLREAASGKHTFVWIVAARSYKAKAVHMAITSGLANALVIDSEIAEYLLTMQ